MKLAAAVATTKKPDEQALACTDCGHGFIGLPVDGIATSHPLVFLVRGPVNIPWMMAGDKDPAVLWPAVRGLPLPESALDQQGFDRTSSPNIGTGVKRIAENVTDEALRGNLPDESCSTDRVGG